MWDFFSGKKTYIISAFLAISAIVGFVPAPAIVGLIPIIQDFMTSPQMVTLLEGFGLATLRHGVAR